MLIPHPTLVTFGDLRLDGVAAITIDRTASREILDFSDLGPHAAFADVPEMRTQIRITRRLERAEFTSPLPGDQAELAFTAASGTHDADRRRIRATCVLIAARHEITEAATDRISARQTLVLMAVSADGAADPITIEPA